MDDPSPAPCSTSTVCPARTSSVTPAGVSATRYSRFLTSRGTPTRIVALLVPAGRPEGDGRPTVSWARPVGARLARSLGRRNRSGRPGATSPPLVAATLPVGGPRRSQPSRAQAEPPGEAGLRVGGGGV